MFKGLIERDRMLHVCSVSTIRQSFEEYCTLADDFYKYLRYELANEPKQKGELKDYTIDFNRSTLDYVIDKDSTYNKIDFALNSLELNDSDLNILMVKIGDYNA